MKCINFISPNQPTLICSGNDAIEYNNDFSQIPFKSTNYLNDDMVAYLFLVIGVAC